VIVTGPGPAARAVGERAADSSVVPREGNTMSTHTAPYGALAGAGLAELAERLPTSHTLPDALLSHLTMSGSGKRGNFNSFIENKGNFNSFIDKKGNFNSFIEPGR
jgi:hypothetical protein